MPESTVRQVDTIVQINDAGRIVVPRDERRVLDLEDSLVELTVRHDGRSADSIVRIDASGRTTIPKAVREFLGIRGGMRIKISLSPVE